MSKLDELLFSLKNELLKEECIQNYLYYKKIVDNDIEIKKLDEDLRFHQKEMCRNQDNDVIYFKEKKIYQELKDKFDNNPILINYQIARDEVFSLLVDIKNILS